MLNRVRLGLCGIGLCTLAGTAGFGQLPTTALTTEERLAALEIQVATLDTRLNTRTTTGASSLGSSDAGLAAQMRIDALEREVDALSRLVRDLGRQVDTARREAAEARREARNALTRIR